MKQHTTACAQCPWRRTSAPGYLGASGLDEFMETSEAEFVMPCHLRMDYEDPNWEETVLDAPQCAGRAAHFANRLKRPRNPFLIIVDKDPEVFTTLAEFAAHHGGDQ